VADPDDHSKEEGGTGRGIDFLEVARQAAAARQPERMLEALDASKFLDGLTRRLESRWRGRLPRAEIEQCVAVAVDAAYDAVANGKPVRSLGAWIWKVAWHKCVDCWSDDYEARSTIEPENLSVRAEEPVTEEADRLQEYRTAEAIRLARTLVPRIGQGQIVDVMTIVIDAVEQGVEDLPPATIAEAVGLSVSAVRSLMSRGFERLEREARSAGITLPESVPALVGDASEGDDRDD
jgi:DNA-directed RNA polymerase specialized sigma24 family protein